MCECVLEEQHEAAIAICLCHKYICIQASFFCPTGINIPHKYMYMFSQKLNNCIKKNCINILRLYLNQSNIYRWFEIEPKKQTPNWV